MPDGDSTGNTGGVNDDDEDEEEEEEEEVVVVEYFGIEKDTVWPQRTHNGLPLFQAVAAQVAA